MKEIFGVDTRVAYLLGVMSLVVVERIGELVVARRNLRRLLARGAVEEGAGHYPVMVALHTLFLLSCPAEIFLLDRPFIPWLAAVAGAVLIAAMCLRCWVVGTLGDRWTTRIVVLPGAEPVTGGPFRYLRHPNYLAVVLEIVAIPMIHTAWLTAIVFTLANAALLRVRIRAEEAALSRVSGYHEAFARNRGAAAGAPSGEP